jgi:hypothetical protein
MKRLKKYMAVIVVVIMLASPVFALDKEGNVATIPGFATETTGVDTSQSVVNITVQGNALGLYPGDDWKAKYGYGVFGMQGSGFCVNNYIITAAHVVNPTQVLIRRPDGSQFWGPIVNVTDMTIIVSGSPARVFSINIEEDWAILVFTYPTPWLQNLKIKCTDTIHYFLTLFGWYAENQLHPGDMLVAIVRVRDAAGDRTTLSELRIGKVVADKPIVPPGYEDQLPWFNLNDFTIDILLLPGDSGSPIIGFIDGVPYLVGIGRAAVELPTGEYYGYATRIDTVKMITESTFE